MNRYLEKIARNKFEQHLANKPRTATFDSPKVQRAHKLVQESKSVNRQGQALHQLGAKKEVVDKYLEMSRQIMRKQRGEIHSTAKVKVESPFKNTGDSLSKIRRNATNRVAHFEEQNPGYKRLLKFIKRNKGKSAFVAGGVAAGAGLIGAGVNSLVKQSKDCTSEKNRYLSKIASTPLLEGPAAPDLPKYKPYRFDPKSPYHVSKDGAETYDSIEAITKHLDARGKILKKYKTKLPISNAKSSTAYTKLRRYVLQHPYKVAGGAAAIAGVGYGAKKFLSHDKE